jgi:hypothetical protein
MNGHTITFNPHSKFRMNIDAGIDHRETRFGAWKSYSATPKRWF